MKPEICKNCCANEFIEQDDAYVCAYCNSRYHKAPAKVVTEIRYVEVPVPVSEPAKQEIQTGERKNKWVAFFWCLFMGGFGAHKFYEGRMGMGLLYFFTVGLFGIGWGIDLINLLFKPNPYYVLRKKA